MKPRHTIRFSFWALIIGVVLMGCAVGLQSVDEDKVMGRQVAQQVESTMGVYEDPRLTPYVNTVGRRLVAIHEDQRFTYTFSIVDQAEANAFAAPGGYIYVSRGMLALANSEDELANIIGHEIIHVSSRHTAQQMAKARVPGLLSLPGRVVGGVLSDRLGNLINAPINMAGGAFIAKHGREQEFESDRYGQVLAAGSGYDPQALATALARLEQESKLMTGQERKASFFDTHPMTPDRVARLTRDAQNIEWTRQPGVTGDAAAYLRRLDGLLIGPNPVQGVIHGRKILQPALDCAVTFPEGWQLINTRRAVIAAEPNQEGLLVMSIAGKDIAPHQAADELIRALEKGYGAKPSISKYVEVGPYPGHLVTYTDDSGREPMHIHFVWFAYRGLLYQYVGLGPERLRPILRDAALSFRPLTDAERSGIKEMRLQIVTAKGGETLSQLSEREHNALKMEYTAVINGIDADQPLLAGQLVKIAVLKPYSGPVHNP
jgi:predicted Zn-dependent protease